LGCPFIIGFMVLLMSAATSLMVVAEFLANKLSIYAYYALVVRVVLQFVCFPKYTKKNDGEKV
jgi:hypothetical protein